MIICEILVMHSLCVFFWLNNEPHFVYFANLFFLQLLGLLDPGGEGNYRVVLRLNPWPGAPR